MGRPGCHQRSTIDYWIEDVEIELWNMQKVIDFEKYTHDPTYWTNLMYTSNLLNKGWLNTNYVYISKHIYYNLNSWLPFAS